MKKIMVLVLALLLMTTAVCYADKSYTIDENGWLWADLDNDGNEETMELFCLPLTDYDTVPVCLFVYDHEYRIVGDMPLFEYFNSPIEDAALRIDLYLPENGILAASVYAGVEMPILHWVYFRVGDEELTMQRVIEDPGYTSGVGLRKYEDPYDNNPIMVYEAEEYDETAYLNALNAQFAGTGVTFSADADGVIYPDNLTSVYTFTEKDVLIYEGDVDESMLVYYVYADGNVKLRSEPTTDSEELGVLKKGEIAEYLDETVLDDRNVAWYKILLDGKEGWVSSKFAMLLSDYEGEMQGEEEETEADGESTIRGYTEVEITGKTVNVRNQPMLDGESLGILKKGDTAELLGATSIDDRGVEWYQIKFDGDEGWISSKYAKLQ